MDLGGVLDGAFGAVNVIFASVDHAAHLTPDGMSGPAMTLTDAGSLALLFGFLLTLLSAFALAVVHGTQPWRNISIFLNGIALASGISLVAAELGLMAMSIGTLELLRITAGLSAAVSVIVLWPSLAGLGVRAEAGHQSVPSLPLMATPGGPLSLEDALAGTGATIFARTPDLAERWSVPRAETAAHASRSPLMERLTATLQTAFSRKAPVADQFKAEDPENGAQWYELTVRPGQFSDGQDGAIGCLLDVTRFRQAEAECRHMLQEATHRAKNLLTIIQSVARMSVKTLGLPATAADPFNARLQAVAMSYDLLVRENWEGAPLNDVVHSQLNHTLSNAAARASWSGPALRLKPTAVQTLSLAVHELAARSLAQGAMAAPTGRLRISWEDAQMREGVPGYRLVWQEIGHGPEPTPDTRNYARDILERLTPRGLRGEVTASQTDEGFRWEVRFPAAPNVLLPPQD